MVSTFVGWHVLYIIVPFGLKYSSGPTLLIFFLDNLFIFESRVLKFPTIITFSTSLFKSITII